jgi:DNA-directed RNA polymerase specialized sigma24 family protein
MHEITKKDIRYALSMARKFHKNTSDDEYYGVALYALVRASKKKSVEHPNGYKNRAILNGLISYCKTLNGTNTNGYSSDITVHCKKMTGLIPTVNGTEQKIINRDLCTKILNKLGEKYREILWLKTVEGMEYSEIQQHSNEKISISGLKLRHLRALKKARQAAAHIALTDSAL